MHIKLLIPGEKLVVRMEKHCPSLYTYSHNNMLHSCTFAFLHVHSCMEIIDTMIIHLLHADAYM